MNWRQATRSQLYEIAYNDKAAPLEHRIAAGNELKRRARRQYGRINYKAKEVYPR